MSTPPTQPRSQQPSSLSTSTTLGADSSTSNLQRRPSSDSQSQPPPQTQPLTNPPPSQSQPVHVSSSQNLEATNSTSISHNNNASLRPEPSDNDLDATIATEIQMEVDMPADSDLPATQNDTLSAPNPSSQLDGTGDAPAGDAAGSGSNVEGIGPGGLEEQAVGIDDIRVPQKKDVSLRDFLSKMDEYGPIIPDAVTTHYLTSAGLPPPPTTPLPLARLLALATQKFIADIAADSYQYARLRSSNSSSSSNPLNAFGVAGAGIIGGAAGAGAPGGTSAAGGGGAGGTDSNNKGGPGGKPGAHLGVQRPGFGGGGSGGAHGGRTVLTMEDLGMAVGEYGVSVRRGEFYR